MKKQKRYRIGDVAKHAGVSEATVSVVLNDRVGETVRVSPETQRKVWDAVRELGYVPNPAARSLARGRNHLIAVFTFESIFPLDSRNFYYPFLIGIEEEAAAQGYDLLLSTAASDDANRGRIYRNGVNRLKLADGAVLLGHASDKSEVIQLLADEFPFVYVGRRDSPANNISYAAADYAGATEQVVEYLFAHEHRRLAYLATHFDTEATRDRYAGYVQAHLKCRLELDSCLTWRGTAESFTIEEFRRLLKQGATGVIAENDELALRALSVAGADGLRAPDDYSLAVLGDPLSMVEAPYTWTAFRIPRREMGREAVRLLISMLSNSANHQRLYRTILPCQFVEGNTVGVPRTRVP
jgi:DNA-binding LacI/PurR family transcriptional regulator